jgi:hypothetical protein
VHYLHDGLFNSVFILASFGTTWLGAADLASLRQKICRMFVTPIAGSDMPTGTVAWPIEKAIHQ